MNGLIFLEPRELSEVFNRPVPKYFPLVVANEILSANTAISVAIW
jgi:hypothetical protein